MDDASASRARHDIRGHLNAIAMFGTLAATSDAPDDQLECLGTIERQADAVIDIINRHDLAAGAGSA